jgi:hypothetical protein
MWSVVMNPIEDKVRRRLAPFVAEGKILTPQFTAASGPALTVAVRLKPSLPRTDEVEAALHNAVRDLGAEAQLVISAA